MKLASAERILSLTPIPGADQIETAQVLGWQVVVRKGEYKVGDLCAYIQIDTVVPALDMFEFLKDRDYRVRTIKLRKQLSQGLIVPLPGGRYSEGDDLTDILGVKKFEKPDNNPVYQKERMPKVWYKKWWYMFKYNVLYKLFPGLRKKTRSPFPTNLVPITDEERIQNLPHVLESHKGKLFNVTYKLDGSSITIIHNKFLGRSRFRICSRRFELHDKKNEWYRVFNDTFFDRHILNLVEYFQTNDIIVQGEAVGSFNGNHHALHANYIFLFNIWADGQKVSPAEFHQACQELNIPHVPLFGVYELNHTIGEILKMSEVPDCLNPHVPAEGLVWACQEDNLSFKAINNQYLLKEK